MTGATGALGGRVARRLADAGVVQRLLVRDAGRAPDLSGAEVVRIGAGYTDGDAMRAALDGVHTLLLVSASESKDRRDVHAAAVDAAVDAGVVHIVYVSFVGAGPHATFTFARDHGHTEEHIKARGVAHTVLRDNMYLDFVPNFVGADGVLRGPAGNGRFGGVTRDDVADVAVAVLTSVAAGEDTHVGRVYDVTGRETISMAEVAAQLTRASGRLITYDAETLDQAYASRVGVRRPGLGGRRLGHVVLGDRGRRTRRGHVGRRRPDRPRADDVRRVSRRPPRRHRPPAWRLTPFGRGWPLRDDRPAAHSRITAL